MKPIHIQVGGTNGIIARVGIERFPGVITQPQDKIAFACVVWQDAGRLEQLLRRVRPYFSTVAVVVQESTDNTLEVAREWADIVETDAHHGFGDASFGPKLLPRISQEWTFKVDADEMPSEELLESLCNAVQAAEMFNVDGVWIPFQSSIDGRYWDEQHSHLRLFKTHYGWPNTLHSRPPINQAIEWQTGFIDHSRSLDEMIADYLSYYRIGRGNQSWDNHNKLMMREACRGAAEATSWDEVRQKPWWPEVRDIAFDGKEQRDFMVVFAGGPSCSGTRMLYDMVGKLGLKVVHASLPGYHDNPTPPPHFDVANPIWWTKEEMEAEYGEGGSRWVIITRDPEFAGQCAVTRGFVSSRADYADYHARAMETLDGIEDAYRLTYEELLVDPQGEFDKLADWLGVDHANVGTIFDGNAKYQKAPETVDEPARPVRRPRRVKA